MWQVSARQLKLQINSKHIVLFVKLCDTGEQRILQYHKVARVSHFIGKNIHRERGERERELGYLTINYINNIH